VNYREQKESMILTAMEVLKKNGYEYRLCNKQNGHIQVKSRRNVIYNFYPTTGTIAGYDWNETKGIDALLQILEVG